MPSTLDEARLAGTILSGRSSSAYFGPGVGPYEGMFSIGTGTQKRGRKVVKGSRKDLRPIGVTAGEYEPPMLTFSFAEQSALVVKEQIAQNDPNGTSYGDAAGFTVTFVLTESLAQGTPIVYAFTDCWFEEDGVEMPVSAEELKNAFKIGCLGMTVTGADGTILTLYSSQQ